MTEIIDVRTKDDYGALDLVVEYEKLGKDIAAMEARKEELKPKLNELRQDADKRAIPCTINGVPFEYVVSKITQDKRKLDEDKLAQFLLLNSYTVHAIKYKPVPNDEEVNKLLKDGTITKAQIEACLIGKIISYSLVTRREVKDDKS